MTILDIDCGLDGNYEYRLELSYDNNKRQDIDINLILRNAGGHLVISFVSDNYFDNLNAFMRNVDIKDNGLLKYKKVEDDRIFEYYYYLDEKGDCNYLYHEVEFGASASNALYITAGDERTFTVNHSNGEEVTFNGHSFSVEAFYDPTADIWYAYSFKFYDNNNNLYPSESDEYQKLQKFCQGEGYIILTESEAREKQQEIRDQYGFTSDIYYY